MNSIYSFICSNNKYIEDFITRSTYNSNAIEGSTLTYVETYAILYNDNSFKIQCKEPREIYEAINHKRALEFVFDCLKSDVEFDDTFIKRINIIINKDIKETDGYRKVQVFIRGAEFIPPKPNQVLNKMLYFVDNYNNYLGDDIFIKIAKFHIEFDKIHPFEDGNGRTGRILLNYELIRNNFAPIVISKEDRIKYFELLKNENIEELASWFKELSIQELDRMKEFGFEL